MSIISEIRDEINIALAQEPKSRDLTILALLLLLIPGLIGSYKVFLKGADSGWYWIAAGVIIAASRLIPPFFRAFFRVWVSMAVTLGYFVSRILLTIVFVVVMIPTGLIMRVVGKDPMERKLDPAAETYWIEREPAEEGSLERYEKQF